MHVHTHCACLLTSRACVTAKFSYLLTRLFAPLRVPLLLLGFQFEFSLSARRAHRLSKHSCCCPDLDLSSRCGGMLYRVVNISMTACVHWPAADAAMSVRQRAILSKIKRYQYSNVLLRPARREHQQQDFPEIHTRYIFQRSVALAGHGDSKMSDPIKCKGRPLHRSGSAEYR